MPRCALGCPDVSPPPSCPHPPRHHHPFSPTPPPSGALWLHLAQRLERLLRASRGGHAAEGRGAGADHQSASDAPATADGCALNGQEGSEALPDLPPFPEGTFQNGKKFQFTLPPLPGLLPKSWLSEPELGMQLPQSEHTPPTAETIRLLLASTGGGAALVCVGFWRFRRGRTPARGKLAGARGWRFTLRLRAASRMKRQLSGTGVV